MEFVPERTTTTAAAAHQRTYGGNNAFHNFGVFRCCRYGHDVNQGAKADTVQQMITPIYKIPTCGGGLRSLKLTRRRLVHTVCLPTPVFPQSVTI